MRLIKLPNDDYIAADAIVLISALDQHRLTLETIPPRVIVYLKGGSSSRINCNDFAHAKKIAGDLVFNISRVE